MKPFVLLSILVATLAVLIVACGAPAATPEIVPATQAPTEASSVSTTFDGHALMNERCTACHGLDRVTSVQKNEAQWKVTIDRMVSRGASLNQAEAAALASFLASSQ